MESNIVDRRRDLVKHLHFTRLSVSQIVAKIDGHGELSALFPAHSTYEERKRIIRDDIKTIQADLTADIAIEEFDAKQKHAEYIGRQEFLYTLALRDGNLPLANEVSKTIAKAYGIQTDEPIVVKTDTMALMQAAFKKMQNREQPKIEEQTTEVIDITPQAVKPAADVILAKR